MQLRTLKDLTTLIEQLESSWNQTTDPDALLEQLHASYTVGDDNSGFNLLNFIATQHDTISFENMLKRCLDLIEKIAHHRKTDLVQLLNLFTAVSTITKRNACGWMSKYYQDQIEKYCQIIHVIAWRHDHSDASLHALRKLITHHDQRGQERGKEFDGSIVFDLVETARRNNSQQLLENYLATLVHLAENKKIDSDSIYNALRTPLGITENIGTKIANTYNGYHPECFLHFTRLCDFLAPSQIDQIFPSSYAPFVYNFKDNVCDYIENLPTPEERIAICERARDKDSALGRFMLFKRDNNECSDERGANSRLKEIYGNALVLREEQKKNYTKAAEKLPKASAPLLEESQYMRLFSNADKSEYETYIKRASQKFEFKHADEATKALRYAAAYGHNDDLVNLLEEHNVNVNAHNDVGDKCADATALYLAVEQNNVEGVRILLEHQANPNIERRLGVTPICFAAVNGNVDIARLLLKHGAKVNVVSRYKNSPLYFAARMGNPEFIRMIIDHYRETYDNDIQSLVDFLRKDSQLLHSIEDAADGETLLALAKLTDFLAEKGVNQAIIDTMIPQSHTFKNKKLKESLVEAIKKLPKKEQPPLCVKIAYDSNNLLYKIVRIKRGGLLGKKPRYGAGILGQIEAIIDSSENKEPTLVTAYWNSSTNTEKDYQHYEEALRVDENHVIVTYRHGLLLLFAVARNDVRMIKLLLKHGADPAARRWTGINVIKDAIILLGHNLQRLNEYIVKIGNKDVVEIRPEELAELCYCDDVAALLRKHREAHEQSTETVKEIKADVSAATPVPVFVPPEVPQLSHVEPTQQVPEPAVVEQQVERLYPELTYTPVPQSDPLQEYLLKAKQKQAEPAPFFVVTPLAEEPLPQAPAAAVSDPFAAIDTILMAPAVPKKPSWIEDLNEIDFSQTEPSSTAVIMHQLSDLMSFEEPAKSYVNPFDELVEQEKQPVAAKSGYQNPFDEMTEDQREARVAAQLAALPPAPQGLGLFAARAQETSKATEKSKKLMAAN